MKDRLVHLPQSWIWEILGRMAHQSVRLNPKGAPLHPWWMGQQTGAAHRPSPWCSDVIPHQVGYHPITSQGAGVPFSSPKQHPMGASPPPCQAGIASLQKSKPRASRIQLEKSGCLWKK